MRNTIGAALLLTGLAALPSAAMTLSIPLDGVPGYLRYAVQYRCDAKAHLLGLPTGKFRVDYYNAPPNDLAVLPIRGASRVMAGTVSADGAKYVSGPLTWWRKGPKATATLGYGDDDPAAKSSECTEAAG